MCSIINEVCVFCSFPCTHTRFFESTMPNYRTQLGTQPSSRPQTYSQQPELPGVAQPGNQPNNLKNTGLFRYKHISDVKKGKFELSCHTGRMYLNQAIELGYKIPFNFESSPFNA